MSLLEAFEHGHVKSVPGLPLEIIETQISKLYLYKDRVLKTYKHLKTFFGDFSNIGFRKKYYQEDFSWNKVMAPKVYLHLRPVISSGDLWLESDISKAEDFYIEMARIDINRNLTKLLLEKGMNDNDVRNIAVLTIKRLAGLTRDKKITLGHVIKIGWKNIFMERLNDIDDYRLEDSRQWGNGQKIL